MIAAQPVLAGAGSADGGMIFFRGWVVAWEAAEGKEGVRKREPSIDVTASPFHAPETLSQQCLLRPLGSEATILFQPTNSLSASAPTCQHHHLHLTPSFLLLGARRFSSRAEEEGADEAAGGGLPR